MVHQAIVKSLTESTEHIGLPKLMGKSDEENLEDMFEKLLKPKREKKLDNHLDHLKSTQFMQELNTI